MFLSNIIKLC